jgi:hypothetical protein
LIWLDAAFLLLSPVAAWAVLQINLINQAGYVDPWLYTGYGQVFERLIQVFGWRYYALRFPVIFLNSLCCSGDAPVVGYALLRYALLLVAGVPLYLLSRRHFGRTIAVCSYLFLFCNPLFLRLLLWDLTPFVSIPAALAGITVWMLADKHRLSDRFLAGALFAVSISAHVFTATAIGCFLLVEIVLTLRNREDRRTLVPDLACAALGAAVVVVLGVVYYRLRIGAFDPRLLVSGNLLAMKAGNSYVTSHAEPVLRWTLTAPYACVPLILLGAIAALRRAQPRSTIDRRILWFLAVYCGFYAGYCVIAGSFVIDNFYYFHHLTIPVFLAVPLVVSMLARLDGSTVPVAVAFSLGLLLPVVALRIEFDRTVAFLRPAYGDLSRMSVFWVLSALLVILMAIRRLPRGAVWAAAFLLATSLQFATLVHPPHLGVFGGRGIAIERGVYLTSVQYARFVARFDRNEHRVLAWYPWDAWLMSVTFSVQGDALNYPFAGPGMPTVGKRELSFLTQPNVRYVMLLATNPRDIARGKAALDEVGIGFKVVESRRLGDSAYSAIAELLEIIRPPS